MLRSVSRDDTWREDGKRVFNSLVRFWDVIIDVDGTDINAILTAVDEANTSCLTTLNEWIHRHAPGSENQGRKDPSRGGFAFLGCVFQDAYQSACLTNLAAVGSTCCSKRLASDGMTERVDEAFRLAVDWNEKAMAMASAIIDQVDPLRSQSSNTAAYFAYCDTVESGKAAYKELQPYLNELYAAGSAANVP